MTQDAQGWLLWATGGGSRLALDWDGPVLRSESTSPGGGPVDGAEILRTVDGHGRLAQDLLGAPVGAGTVYSYDADGWITGVSFHGDTTPVVVSYPDAHTVQTHIDGVGLTTRAVTSELGELSRLATTDGAGATQLDRTVCTRDALGRERAVVETIRRPAMGRAMGAPSDTWLDTYEYDAVGRLRSWRRYEGCDCAAVDFCTGRVLGSGNYTYDPSGNRTDIAGLVPDADDQLTGGGRRYDDLGQLSARGSVRVPPRASVPAETFYHDRLGRLGSYARGGLSLGGSAGNATYVHDVLGRLVSITTGSGAGATTQSFLHRDARNPVAWRVRTARGDRWAYFGYATDPETPDVAWMDDDGDGAIDRTLRLLSDERGSVRLAIDIADGAIVQRIDYDPWGQPTFSGSDAHAQPFGYAGGIWDEASSLWHLGARVYEPQTGTFTTPDPLGLAASLNLYSYCDADPINCRDPSGLSSWHLVRSFLQGTAEGVVGGVIVAGLLGAGGGWAVLGGALAVWGALQLGLELRAIISGYDLSGERICDSARADMAAHFLGGLLGGGISAAGYGAGREFRVPWLLGRGPTGRPGRIAPWGNRTGHRYGELPHYHRAIPDPSSPGNSLPGQGMGNHRPWEGGW